MKKFDFKFTENAESFPLGFEVHDGVGDPSAFFDADMESFRVIREGTMETYSGAYTVTPKAYDEVILPTKEKSLYEDIKVLKVPRFDTSNTSGTTVYIAKEA